MRITSRAFLSNIRGTVFHILQRRIQRFDTRKLIHSLKCVPSIGLHQFLNQRQLNDLCKIEKE